MYPRRVGFAAPALSGSATVYRAGHAEMELGWHSQLTVGELLNAAANTCSRNSNGWYTAWRVQDIHIFLCHNGARPAFETSLEESARINMLRAAKAIRRGRFTLILTLNPN